MKTAKRPRKQYLLVLLLTAMLPVSAVADDKYDALKAQVDALEQQLEQVQQALKLYEERAASKQDVEELRNEVASNTASKQDVTELRNDVAEASEWKEPNTLIHMSGYADVGYTSGGDNHDFNIGSFSPIFHYQYRDLVMLESELELEINQEGETELALEYLTVDLFLGDYVALVGGKFLSPIGQFRQNLHPSWINKLTSAPPGFGHDGAAPTSEMGLQLRGGFELGSMHANYSFYVSNGPELISEFEHGEFELEGVIAEGLGADNDGEKVFGGRLGLLPLHGLEVGLSAATGKATATRIEVSEGGGHGIEKSPILPLNTLTNLGPEEPPVFDLDAEQARDYDVLGIDFVYHLKGFQLRGEYVQTKIGPAYAGITASPGASWESWYTQASYLMPQTKWEPVIRYTDFTAPQISRSQKQWAVGLNYLFSSSVIGKLSYEFNDSAHDSNADTNRFLFQLAYGF